MPVFSKVLPPYEISFDEIVEDDIVEDYVRIRNVIDSSGNQVRISNEQINIVYKIIHDYSEANVRSLLLVAQMQSGKSGVYYFLAAEMLRLEKVNKVVITCASAELELRNQIEITAYRKFIRQYSVYLTEDIGLENIEAQKITAYIEENIKIITGTQLKKTINFPTENTLFINDESHFAQTKGMCPDQFFKNAGVSVNGNNDILERKNNYLLSVSATPFSEVSDTKHNVQFKKIVHFDAGPTYFGIKKMMELNNIVYYKNWKEGLSEAMDVVNREQTSPNSPKKYGLLRIADKGMEDAKRIAQQHGWDVKYYNSDKLQCDFDPSVMKKSPTRNTLILLKGMWRMGKDLEKRYVGFVFETVKSPKTDSLLQGLIGRVSGHHKYSNIKIYLNESISKNGELERYIQFIDNGDVIPKKAMNIMKQKSTKFNESNPIIPIILNFNGGIDGSNDINYTKENKPNIIESIRAKFNNNDIIDLNCSEQSEEIVRQIMTLDESKFEFIQLRKNPEGEITRKSAKDVPRIIYESIKERIPRRLGSSNGIEGVGEKIKIWIAASAFPEFNIRIGDYFVDTRTNTFNPKHREIDNIPKSNGKSMFK